MKYIDIQNLTSGTEFDKLILKLVFTQEFITPTHGICCTCQICGYSHDECVCGISDNAVMAIEMMEHLIAQDWEFEIHNDNITHLWECSGYSYINNRKSIATNSSLFSETIWKAIVLIKLLEKDELED